MSGQRRVAVLLFVLFGIALAPRNARACWYGKGATVGRVCQSASAYIDAGPFEWSVQDARAYAADAHRLSLLAPGADIRVREGSHSSCGPGIFEEELGAEYGAAVILCPDGGSCIAAPVEPGADGIFDALAGLAKAGASERKRARQSQPPPIFTVQMLAARNESSAQSVSAQVDDAGAGGFYWSGGKPAKQPSSEVVHGPDGLHRVYAGAFLSHSAALEARDDLRESVGLLGFVRELR